MSRNQFSTIPCPFPTNRAAVDAVDAVNRAVVAVRTRHQQLDQEERQLMDRAASGRELDAVKLLGDARDLRTRRLAVMLAELEVMLLKEQAHRVVGEVAGEMDAELSGQLVALNNRMAQMPMEERAALLPGRLELIGRLTHIRDQRANFRAILDPDLWHAAQLRETIRVTIAAEMKPPSPVGMSPAGETKQTPPTGGEETRDE